MKVLARLVFCSGISGALLAACNGILGITELTDPGDPDSGGAAGDAASSAETGPGPRDDGGLVPDGSVCGSVGEVDPCLVIEPQADGGAIFPTWSVTSDLQIQDTNLAVIQPTRPVYADAGANIVLESFSKLTWQSALAASGSAVTYGGAVSACKVLGTGWRVPTRMELSTTQYRNVATTADAGPTSCIPTPFTNSESSRLWTSTQVPGASNVASNYAPTEAPGCGFFALDRASTANVRCVKAELRAATFLVSKKADTVYAKEASLEWERTGVIVTGYTAAKAHCDAIGWRVPVIQELYAILDPRETNLFHPGLFVKPAGPIAPRAILSQTVAFFGSGAPFYWAPALIDAPFGTEDAASSDDGVANLLVRCVHRK